MSTDDPNLNFISTKRKFQLEEGILIFLLFLSLVGVGISHYSPPDGYGYWIAMIFVFGLFSILIGWLQSKQTDADVRKLLIEQSFHWGSCMLVVAALFTLLHTDHITSDSTGLIMLLILSLATFLDGQRVGWRFSLIGFFLGISAVISAHMSNPMLIEILLAIAIVASTLMWDEWFAKLKEKLLGGN
jgi:cobalamin synthase